MEKLTENVWKLNVDSNVYLLPEHFLVIDTGPSLYREIVKKELGKVLTLEKLKKVVFTHLHYDHCGNADLFPNADFYASAEEIADFKADMRKTTLNPGQKDIPLKPLEKLDGFAIIKTPGHTRGSICLFYQKEKILFSGDTLFFNGNMGRLDLPTSVPDAMESSLKKLEEIDYRILAPGHDY